MILSSCRPNSKKKSWNLWSQGCSKTLVVKISPRTILFVFCSLCCFICCVIDDWSRCENFVLCLNSEFMQSLICRLLQGSHVLQCKERRKFHYKSWKTWNGFDCGHDKQVCLTTVIDVDTVCSCELCTATVFLHKCVLYTSTHRVWKNHKFFCRKWFNALWLQFLLGILVTIDLLYTGFHFVMSVFVWVPYGIFDDISY